MRQGTGNCLASQVTATFDGFNVTTLAPVASTSNPRVVLSIVDTVIQRNQLMSVGLSCFRDCLERWFSGCLSTQTA
jgi:hypothetical protein